jgi:hypothetical protein
MSFLGDLLDHQCKSIDSVASTFIRCRSICFDVDEIRRTLGEGTFGKVVEVLDLRE